MFQDYGDRLLAEEAWAEIWAEIQSDPEALRDWEEAQAREVEIQAGIEAAYERGEVPF
jgi:hypothetical protein